MTSPRWLAIGGAALAIVVAAVLAFALLGGDSDEPAASNATPTPPPTSTEAPDPTATPASTGNPEEGPLTEIGGVAVRDLSIGPEIALPGGLVLYYRESCYACDGAGQLYRAYRDQSGTLMRESIQLGLPADTTGLHTLNIAPGATSLLAQFCDPGSCSRSGGFEPGAVPHTYLSTDGGITWEEQLPGIPAESEVRGSVGGEWLVVTLRPGRFNHRYWLYPSDTTLVPPIDYAEPWPSGDGGFFWWEAFDPQRTIQVDANGDLLPGISVDPDVVATFMTGDIDGEAFYSGYARQDFSMRGSTGIYLVQTDGDRAAAAYRWPHFSINGLEVIDDRWLIGNALYPDGEPDSQAPQGESQTDYRPVLIDLESATVHSIAQLTRGRDSRWSYPAEVAEGEAVLRVATDGSCLNVRAEPTTDAESLRCYVDGVLLLEREADAPEGWVAVTTPDGREGWASADYLER